MSTEIIKLDQMQDAVLAPVVEAVSSDKEIATAVDAAEYAMSIVVDNPHAAAEAEASIVHITKGRKKLEAARKPITQIIDALKKSVMDYVKGIDTPLNEADKYLANQLAKYRSKAAADAENARIAQEKARADAAATGAPPPIVRAAPATVAPSMAPEGTSVGTTWTLNVELERPYEAPDHLLVLAPGAKAWMQAQIDGGELDLPKKDGATTLHRGIRATWAMGISRRAGS